VFNKNFILTSENNQNSSNLLVTTPLDGTWRGGENIVFLGEWCKKYSKNNVYNSEVSTVIPYHWKNRKKFREDHKYLSNLYKEMLIKVSLELNSVHKTEHSLEYWQIITGPWLLTYVAVVFDRWENIRLAADLGIPLKTVVPSSATARSATYDYNSSMQLMMKDDEWNYLLYCDILQVQNAPEIEIIRERVIIENRSISINKGRRLRPIRMVAKLLDYMARKICLTDSYNILLYKSYFSIKNLMRLNLKLKQIPRLHLEFEKYIHCEDLNSSMRSGLHEDCSSSEFENFLMKNIFKDMPKVYIEGYRNIFLYCKKLPKAKVIFTANAHYGDEVFKNWMARQVENGSKLIIGEHGGSIPTSISENLLHEETICFKKTVWHSLLHHLKHVSMPINKKMKKVSNLKGVKVTLIGLELPRYSFRIEPGPGSSLMMCDLEQKTKFINTLNKKARINFKIRPAPNNGWFIGDRYTDMYGNAILSTNKKMFQDFSQSKMIICSYPQTTFSEAMHSGVPTILLFTEDYWEIHPDFNELVAEMKRVNIIHSDPIMAANHINMVHENPFEWWNRDDTVRARNMFFNVCGKNVNDSTTEWSIFFKRVLIE
jgi:putative transferase (TIGR04331 family)